jgi:catalase
MGRGVMRDFSLAEVVAHCRRERIPERTVHARVDPQNTIGEKHGRKD